MHGGQQNAGANVWFRWRRVSLVLLVPAATLRLLDLILAYDRSLAILRPLGWLGGGGLTGGDGIARRKSHVDGTVDLFLRFLLLFGHGNLQPCARLTVGGRPGFSARGTLKQRCSLSSVPGRSKVRPGASPIACRRMFQPLSPL